MANKLRLAVVAIAMVGILGLAIGQTASAAEVAISTEAQLRDFADGTTSNPGDVGLVRAGVYTLTADVNINVRNIKLRCADGRLACKIDGNNANNIQFGANANRTTLGGPNAGFLIRNTGANPAIEINSQLEGIVIEGNRIEEGTRGFQHGIDIQATQRHLRILKNEITGPAANFHGINQTAGNGGLTDAEIRGNQIKLTANASHGISFNGGPYTDLRITGASKCQIAGTGNLNGAGILIGPQADVDDLYISCEVTNNGAEGLQIQNAAAANVVGLTIEKSLFRNNGAEGAEVSVNTGGSRIKDITVRDSRFIQNTNDGFNVTMGPAGTRNIRDVLVEGSTFENNGTAVGDHGVELQATSGGTTVSNVMNVTFTKDVVARGNFDSGVRVATDAQANSTGGDVINVTMDPGTIVTENLRHGVLIEGQRNVVGVNVAGSSITDNGVSPALGWGLRIHAQEAGIRNTTIGGSDEADKNTISGNGEGGIELQANNEISSVSVQRNTIEDNPRHGIRVVASTPAPLIGPSALIQGNVIKGATGAPPQEGIGVLANAKNLELRHNEVADNQIGVKVAEHEGVVIERNNIRGNADFGVDATRTQPATVDAPSNYWGASDGPAPSGTGDEVTSNVDATGFMGQEISPDLIDPYVHIGETQVEPSGSNTLTIRLSAVPEPGLASFQIGPVGAITFDPEVIQVTGVEAVGPYKVMSKTIDNDKGEVRFAVSNNSGENYLVGDGRIVKLDFEAAEGAQSGDATDLTLNTVDLMEAPNPDGGGTMPLVTTIFPGKIRVVPQADETDDGGGNTASRDVNGDGSTDVTDARMVAEAAIGAGELSDEQRAAADVAPPEGTIDITDARFLAEAGLGLRSLGTAPASSEAEPRPEGFFGWLFGWIGGGGSSHEVTLEETNTGLAIELPASAADVQGVLRYDATQGEALELTASGGWTVLAQTIENGQVRFAAARLDGAGGGLTLQASGEVARAELTLEALRDADGQDLAYEVRQPQVQSLALNRVQAQEGGHGLTFVAQGQRVDALRVEVYGLAGDAVYASGWSQGSALGWNLRSDNGQPLANGVYLYRVQVKGATGDVVTSEVRKVLVLR